MVSLPFLDREDAARQLAAELARFRGTHPVVLAIPRGAVPMGRVIADALDGELDVVLVRKLGAPLDPELAVGAVDEAGKVRVSPHARWAGADPGYIEREAAQQLALIRARRARYRPGQAGTALAGRTVIVVDDGLATGATMIAALEAARAQGPARLVCAVPVAAQDSLAEVARYADEVVCLATPWTFGSVGRFYRDFTAISDERVIALLAANDPAGTVDPGISTYPVNILAGDVLLHGDMTSPPSPRGLVIFVHGSGSSRHSPRNRRVAEALNARGLATLLFDLLTVAEDRVYSSRFDISLLARRLDAAIGWAQRETAERPLPIGLFGSSTGAAAALLAAASHTQDIAAVVSRGGRPDLAGADALGLVRVPTLLIVGGDDPEVLALNHAARAVLSGPAEVTTVPGATHLFEEPGALERVADLACDWFLRWFDQPPEVRSPARRSTIAPGNSPRATPGSDNGIRVSPRRVLDAGPEGEAVDGKGSQDAGGQDRDHVQPRQ